VRTDAGGLRRRRLGVPARRTRLPRAAAVNAALAATLGTTPPLRIHHLPPVRGGQDAAYDWIAREAQPSRAER
jgi:hypothetical protein